MGVGGLGSALLSYGGFSKYGIDIVEAFDSDPEKIGTTVGGKAVRGDDELASAVNKYGALLAIVAVPAVAAQQVCDCLAASGVNGILNFAPVQLKAPENVVVRNIDVAASLAILASLL